MRERTDLEDRISTIRRLDQRSTTPSPSSRLGEAEGDEGRSAKARRRIRAAREEAARQQVETLLSGEADGNDTYVEVHSGAGGTESQDWAQMLQRMYARWAERRKYKVELLERLEGEEAGIKSATLLVKGHNAYGWLKTESGVHRLVRISPFDSNARRHTSFASVWVYPVVDDRINIEIKEADCRIDTFRSSGAGGQQSTRRIRRCVSPHPDRDRGRLPAGALAAQEPGDRLEHAARGFYELELKKREEKAAEAAAKTDIGWGHQIRSCCAAALPAREGPAHGRPVDEPATSWTATSMRSWKPPRAAHLWWRRRGR